MAWWIFPVRKVSRFTWPGRCHDFPMNPHDASAGYGTELPVRNKMDSEMPTPCIEDKEAMKFRDSRETLKVVQRFGFAPKLSARKKSRSVACSLSQSRNSPGNKQRTALKIMEILEC